MSRLAYRKSFFDVAPPTLTQAEIDGNVNHHRNQNPGGREQSIHTTVASTCPVPCTALCLCNHFVCYWLLSGNRFHTITPILKQCFFKQSRFYWTILAAVVTTTSARSALDQQTAPSHLWIWPTIISKSPLASPKSCSKSIVKQWQRIMDEGYSLQ